MSENCNSEDLRGQVLWNAEYSVFRCPYVCLVCIRFPLTKHFNLIWEACTAPAVVAAPMRKLCDAYCALSNPQMICKARKLWVREERVRYRPSENWNRGCAAGCVLAGWRKWSLNAVTAHTGEFDLAIVSFAVSRKGSVLDSFITISK